MRGLMMDRPLMTSQIIEYAAASYPEQEVVSRTPEGDLHRYTYRDAARRSRQLANALKSLGVRADDRIATVAWNTHRHLELYYAVSGIGAICHTINPRLPVDQFGYIVNHAKDRYVFLDLTFAPLLDKLHGLFDGVKGYVIMTDRARTGCKKTKTPARQTPEKPPCSFSEIRRNIGPGLHFPAIRKTSWGTMCRRNYDLR